MNENDANQRYDNFYCKCIKSHIHLLVYHHDNIRCQSFTRIIYWNLNIKLNNDSKTFIILISWSGADSRISFYVLFSGIFKLNLWNVILPIIIKPDNRVNKITKIISSLVQGYKFKEEFFWFFFVFFFPVKKLNAILPDSKRPSKTCGHCSLDTHVLFYFLFIFLFVHFRH